MVLSIDQRQGSRRRWDYFGERGLLLKERRSATCQAAAQYCTTKSILGIQTSKWFMTG
jgi:hypothetical protein